MEKVGVDSGITSVATGKLLSVRKCKRKRIYLVENILVIPISNV